MTLRLLVSLCVPRRTIGLIRLARMHQEPKKDSVVLAKSVGHVGAMRRRHQRISRQIERREEPACSLLVPAVSVGGFTGISGLIVTSRWVFPAASSNVPGVV